MTLEALSDEEPRCIVRRGRCVVHGVSGEPETTHRAQIEIAALRNRITELEAALEKARRDKHVALAVSPKPSNIVLHPSPGGAADDLGTPQPAAEAVTFSEAWSDTNATFEERLAARAFFDCDENDEPARRWFLKKA